MKKKCLLLWAVTSLVVSGLHADPVVETFEKDSPVGMPQLSNATIKEILAACSENSSARVQLLFGWDRYEQELAGLYDDFNKELNGSHAQKTQSAEVLNLKLEKLAKSAKDFYRFFVDKKIPNLSAEHRSLRSIEGFRGLQDFYLKLAMLTSDDKGRQISYMREARKYAREIQSLLAQIPADRRALETPGLLARVTRSLIDFETFAMLSLTPMSQKDQLTRYLGIINDSKRLIPRDGNGNLAPHYMLEDAQLDVIEVLTTISVARNEPGFLRPTLYIPPKPTPRYPAIPSMDRFMILVESLPARIAELESTFADDDLLAQVTVSDFKSLELIAPFFKPLYTLDRVGQQVEFVRSQMQVAKMLQTPNKMSAEEEERLVTAAVRNQASSIDEAKKSLIDALDSSDPVRRDRAERVLRMLVNDTFGTGLGLDLLKIARRYETRPGVQFPTLLKNSAERILAFDGQLQNQMGPELRKQMALPGLQELADAQGELAAPFHGFMDELARVALAAKVYSESPSNEDLSSTLMEKISYADAEWVRLQCARVAGGYEFAEKLGKTPFKTYTADFSKCGNEKPRGRASRRVAAEKSDSESQRLARMRRALVHVAPQLINSEISKKAARGIFNKVAADVATLVVAYVLTGVMGPLGPVAATAVVSGAERLATQIATRAVIGALVRRAANEVVKVVVREALKTFVAGLVSSGLGGVRNFIYYAMNGEVAMKNLIPKAFVDEGFGAWAVKTLISGFVVRITGKGWDRLAAYPGLTYVTSQWTGIKYFSRDWTKMVVAKGATAYVDDIAKNVGTSLYDVAAKRGSAEKIKESLAMKEIIKVFLKTAIRSDAYGEVEDFIGQMGALKMTMEDLKELGKCQDCIEKQFQEKVKGPASVKAKSN